MVYRLVQLVSLTMVAVLSGRWQGSKIKQCRLMRVGMVFESMGECTQVYNLFQFITEIDQS